MRIRWRPDRRAMLFGAAAMMASGPGQAQGRGVTEAGMTTEVFDVAGWPAPEGGWRVPLHAWVYRPQDSRVRKAAIAALFQQRYDLATTPDTQALFDRRINLLLADNSRGQQPVLQAGSQTIALPPTRPNGHTRLDSRLATPSSADLVPLGLPGAAGPQARITLVGATGLSVIADIDDTVKDTGVLDRTQLWRSTFFAPFKAVPGMADLLRRVGGGPAPVVHYVSSSPWHLYRPLREWLAADGLPATSLHLKHIRLKDRSILDIAGSPQRHKEASIATLLLRWPGRQFVLVGDSGEADPAVYAAMARRFGAQVQRILIRRAPGDGRTVTEIASPFAGLPVSSWQVFDRPDEVT